MAVSIHDVAKRAGVSISTVSRILNNSANVNEKKAEAVREAMEYYHYEPNQFGRGLVKQKSNMIGVYFPSQYDSIFESTYNLELLKGIERVLPYQNYSMVLINETAEYEHRRQVQPRYLEFIQQKKIDGLIMSAAGDAFMRGEVFSKLLEEGYPLVYIGKRFHQNGMNVYAQFEKYHMQMLRELYVRGHRRVLMIEGEYHKIYMDHIVSAMRTELPELEVRILLLENIDFRRHLLKAVAYYIGEDGCTAVCSPTIETTRVLLGICAQLSYPIPERVSVISVEHRQGDGALEYPAVSAFFVPVIDMGSGAADMLLQAIRGEKTEGDSVEYETKLIERNSVNSLQTV